MLIESKNFHVNRDPSPKNFSELLGLISNPKAPPTVPAGHMYLQNEGSGISFVIATSGMINTKMTTIMYFNTESALVIPLFLILGVLILCKRSCNRPKGQSQPHIHLPNIIP